MRNKADRIKEKIDKILEKENPVYCDNCYDSEWESEEGVWFYDFIIYDRSEKINKIVSQINKYAETTLYKNMDDGDYTIECVIDPKEVTL